MTATNNNRAYVKWRTRTDKDMRNAKSVLLTESCFLSLIDRVQ